MRLACQAAAIQTIVTISRVAGARDPKNAFIADGRTPQQQKIFSYVQKLLRLRREHPVLAQGRLWHLASDDSSYIFERDSDEEKVIIAFNNSKESRQLKISSQRHASTGRRWTNHTDSAKRVEGSPTANWN